MKPVIHKCQLYLNGSERCDFEIWCEDWVYDVVWKMLVDVVIAVHYERLKKISQYKTIDGIFHIECSK